MSAPVVSSVTPSIGLTRGRTFITIVGQNFATQAVGEGDQVKVRVFFGTKEATAVQVVSATQLFCQAPAGDVGAVTVRVTNVDPEESGTLTNGYTYKRPNLTTKTHFQEVCEALVQLFKREVLENVVKMSHSEYDPATGDTKNTPQPATLPIIVLSGPTSGGKDTWTVTETATKITYDSEGNPVSYQKQRAPNRKNLVFELTVGGRIDAEAMSLVHHCIQTLEVTPLLEVTAGSNTVQYQLEVLEDFDAPAKPSNSNVFESTCRFVVQGVLFEDGETLEQGPVVADPTANITYGSDL